MSVQDLLGAILGEGASGAQGSDLDDLVGGLLGGLGGAQSAQSQTRPQARPQSGGLLGGLLGGLWGGSQSNSGLGGILGSILGGGQQQSAAGISNNPLMAGITDALSERLGVSPHVAQGIVSFAMVKLLPLLLDQVQGRRAMAVGAGAGSGAVQGLDLDDLLGRMSGHQGLDHEFLAQSGLAADLSAQTGLDEDTAEEGLRQTLFMLGDVIGGAPKPDPKEGLDDLLDSWQ